MLNYYYKDTISGLLHKSIEEIIGLITLSNQFDSTYFQNKSWEQQIFILQSALQGYEGDIFFEFSIPRMGSRIDAVVIIRNVVFIIEFKVGETQFLSQQVEQVWDYALDLKNFHIPSHKALLVPLLVATEARGSNIEIITTSHNDNLLYPIKSNKHQITEVIETTLLWFPNSDKISGKDFAEGNYAPTPTIIEAAVSLYNNHSVESITRREAEAINLTKTTASISRLIKSAKENSKKIICFVTGVPGAGKTLVGLNIATSHLNSEIGNSSVYLSGNAPLVAILQEALTRDKVKREFIKGKKISKKSARQAVKSFIQIIHHYRDAYLVSKDAPFDHVAIFDEAQRAWNTEQTVKFMRQKKNQLNFKYSEPEFLISCLDRHNDWAVIICLVGGGQEINTGEAGISGWLPAVSDSFPKWEVCISEHLADAEYAALDSIKRLQQKSSVLFDENLHLSVSMRSFRAENLSLFVKLLLDLNHTAASNTLAQFLNNYPIVLTREVSKAKAWLKEKARGTERYGIIVSSQAQRLKPFAIDVKSPIDPVYWFLNEKDDIRSSYFLEDVATEFHVQGLELDWACVIWDGDLRYTNKEWATFSFKGNKWQGIKNLERKKYLINAYRVLLTRARQGIIIVVPNGNSADETRKPLFYDPTFDYLKSLGIKTM